jgi:DNA polymerase elongation subunit (family B)
MYINIHYNRASNSIALWDDRTGYSEFPYKKYCYIKSTNGKFVALDGKRVNKIYSWDKEDEARGVLYESDLNPELRTLIDRYSDSDEPSYVPRVIFLDIEVDVTDSFPDVDKADNAITAISIYTKDTKEEFVFILDTHKTIRDSSNSKTHLMAFKHEEDLLNSFIEWWQQNEPQIVTGWNIDFFDIPYLYNRISKVLGKKIGKQMSPIGVVEQSKSKILTIAGITCLDYLALYKKFSIGEEPSYTLDAISKKEIGRGKTEYEGSLQDLYKNDIKKFIEYNLNDVLLVRDLDEKLDFIELTRKICHKGHVPYNAIFTSSRYLEGAILTYMKQLEIVAPNKPKRIETDEDSDEGKFAGAYVKPPIPGRYEWLNCIDATSLYPSNIMTLNISPETKIGKLHGWSSNNMMSKFKENKTPETMMLEYKNGKKEIIRTKEDLEKFLHTHQYTIAGNGAIYESKNKGLIPAILEKWFAERTEYKSLMTKYAHLGDKEKENYFDTLQYVTKILLNSMYGVLGLESFRFFDLDNAEAVTLTGQDVLMFADLMGNKWIKENLTTDLKKYGIKNPDYCIYSDTDSNYFVLSDFIKKDGTEVEQVKHISKQLCNFINTNLSIFAERHLYSKNNRLVFKEEAAIRSGFWLAKKRYAYHKIYDLEKDVPADKIVVKGLDVVRSNFPKLFREFMKDVLSDILKFKSQESIDLKIVSLQENIKSYSLAELAKPTSAKNLDEWVCKGIAFKKGTPAHIKAALGYNFFLELYGLANKVQGIRSGEKIKWVYLKNNTFNLDAIAFKGYSDPPEIMKFIEQNIDYTRNYESNLQNKLQDFYEALGWGHLPSLNTKASNNFFQFS